MKAEIRDQKSEVRGQRAEVRDQKSEVRGQRAEVRDQKSEVRGQRTEVRSQRSEVRDQKSDHRPPISDHRPPISDLRSPTTDLRPPISDLRPLVSICLPTLNARRFLEPRMQTILAQTLADWELIVCDSFSSDGTWEYFQQFKQDPRVRLYQVPKEGLYAGWNECLRRCRGEYVYIATADDTCKPELLEKMVAALGKAESRKQKVEIGIEDGRRKTEDFGEKAEQRACEQQAGARDSKERSDWQRRKSKVEIEAESGAPLAESQRLRRILNEERRLVRRSLGEGGTKNDEPSQLSTFNLQPNACLQSSVFSLQSNLQPLPADIAVCNFDYIDENGGVITPLLPPAGAFYGDDRYRAHRRSGYMEFLVHLLIGTSWTTMTAVLFRRSLLEKTGLFVTDAGPLADRFWAYKSALHSDTIVMSETLATWRQHPQQGTSPSRNRSLRNVRRLWRKTIEVVEACVPLMPDAWTRELAFLEKLLWAERRHYYDLYCLNRTALRHRPLKFLEGLAKSALLEPGYLMQRLLSGLAWQGDALHEESNYLEALMRDWQVDASDVGTVQIF
jgi:glycosyltransferase involved in cell wall biosynthesis